jgi:hypothetical protein
MQNFNQLEFKEMAMQEIQGGDEGIILKYIIKNINRVRDGFIWLRIAVSHDHCVEPSGSKDRRKHLDQLTDLQLLEGLCLMGIGSYFHKELIFLCVFVQMAL